MLSRRIFYSRIRHLNPQRKSSDVSITLASLSRLYRIACYTLLTCLSNVVLREDIQGLTAMVKKRSIAEAT